MHFQRFWQCVGWGHRALLQVMFETRGTMLVVFVSIILS